MRRACAATLLALLAPSIALADDLSASAPDKRDFSLFDPTPTADLRAFSTDRPPKANSPYTLDAGHFQYETDLAVYSFNKDGGTQTSDWTLVDPMLKLGLTNTVDLELQVTPYEQAITRTAAGSTKVSGWGDTYVRVKVNLIGDDGGKLALALLPYVKLPTAGAALGNGHVEGGLILPVSISAPHGFTVIVMPEIDDLKNAQGPGYHAAFDFLINVSHTLSKTWTLYSEVFTTQSFETGNKPVYTLDEALTFAITPSLQWDFGGNFRVSGAVPNIQLYTGLSQRF